MDSDIYVSSEKRLFDSCSKQSFSSCARIESRGFISLCGDNFGLDRYTRMRLSNCFLDQQGLRARKFAAACSQDDIFIHRENVGRDRL
jgi:hypothetical protein